MVGPFGKLPDLPMRLRLPPLRPEMLTLLISLLLIVCFNLPFWQKMLTIVGPLDATGVLMLAKSLLLVVAFFNAVLLLLAWPWLFRPVAALLLLLSPIVSYFMLAYGVLIDVDMLRNALQTDVKEVRDLVTPGMLAANALGVGLAILAWRVPIAYRPAWRELRARAIALAATLAVLGGVAFAGYQDFASLFRNNHDLHYVLVPNNYIGALDGYFRKGTRHTGPLQVVGGDARRTAAQGARPTVLVLVVGETARAANFGLDGYARDTTPELAKVPELVNFQRLYSCGTATAISLPCMFSRLGRAEFDVDKAAAQENLLDVLTRAGYDVAWYNNNSGCKGVCKRVPYQDLSASSPVAGRCQDGECFDEVLVDALKDKLKTVSRDTVIVLHQKGNHGPAYYKRYPAAFQRWTPVCETSSLQRCEQQTIVNAYDNAIAYTDYVLARVIAELRADGRANGGMIYLSDHGESLGENGLYLHSTPYWLAPQTQTHVPAVMWFSDALRQDKKLNLACLKQRAQQEASQDNLFDSVLGILDVGTKDYNKGRDLFAACRG